ncbi:MAG: hypothetical protein E3J72_02725 [Planctomycetota bacterium]|nr:MAG: hypothetical protein E3J72_02725 [Planctomycetota bacterium]
MSFREQTIAGARPRLADAEKILIKETLSYTGGNKTKAAKLLGIGTRTLYRKLEEYGLPK